MEAPLAEFRVMERSIVHGVEYFFPEMVSNFGHEKAGLLLKQLTRTAKLVVVLLDSVRWL